MKRIAAPLLAALLVVGAVAAGGAAATRSSPGSATLGKASQGQAVSYWVKGPKVRGLCKLGVRYADGAAQPGLKPASAKSGRASWTWRVPETAAPGQARLAVSCGTWRSDATFTVVAKPRTAPKIAVLRQGFSLRYLPLGGSTASFGIVLKNLAPDEDALKVQVLVNFVDPANVVVGSVSQPVSAISAGSTFNFGGSLNWMGYVNVARLEIVVTVGAHAPKSQTYPELANIRIVPSAFDPGYVGEVDGELVNGDPLLTVGGAQLSIVILDAAGNVIGGGTGATFAAVPPRARLLFKASTGFKAVKLDQAVTALISVVPSWRRDS